MPLAKLHLSEAPKDIYVQQFRGLGRGRGFEVKNRTSALKNRQLCERLRNRAAAVVELIDQSLGSSPQASGEREYLRVELEEAMRKEEGLRGEIGRLKDEIRDRERELDDLRGQVRELEAEIEDGAMTLVELEEAYGTAANRAFGLMRALEPLLDEAEYLAYEDESLAALVEDVEEAVEQLREGIATQPE